MGAPRRRGDPGPHRRAGRRRPLAGAAPTGLRAGRPCRGKPPSPRQSYPSDPPSDGRTGRVAGPVGRPLVACAVSGGVRGTPSAGRAVVGRPPPPGQWPWPSVAWTSARVCGASGRRTGTRWRRSSPCRTGPVDSPRWSEAPPARTRRPACRRAPVQVNQAADRARVVGHVVEQLRGHAKEGRGRRPAGPWERGRPRSRGARGPGPPPVGRGRCAAIPPAGKLSRSMYSRRWAGAHWPGANPWCTIQTSRPARKNSWPPGRGRPPAAVGGRDHGWSSGLVQGPVIEAHGRARCRSGGPKVGRVEQPGSRPPRRSWTGPRPGPPPTAGAPRSAGGRADHGQAVRPRAAGSRSWWAGGSSPRRSSTAARASRRRHEHARVDGPPLGDGADEADDESSANGPSGAADWSPGRCTSRGGSAGVGRIRGPEWHGQPRERHEWPAVE